MREVEVKYRVRDTESLLVALESRGVQLGQPVRQDDQAYAPEGWSFGDSKLGVCFVRLRTMNGRHLFTLKRPAENPLCCDEHECEVADRAQMHAAIVAMGFYPTVRIVKTRRLGMLDNADVCVDEVAGVGTFLELERMVPAHLSGEAVQAELIGLVTSLGVEIERTQETYDSLVRDAYASA
jgi:adenylate cyclase class 2